MFPLGAVNKMLNRASEATYYSVRFEGLVVVTIKITVLRDMALCNLVDHHLLPPLSDSTEM